MGVLTQYENDISSGIDNDLLSSINKIGTDPLTTTAQTLSGAVNELDNDVDNLETKVGSATLTTTAQDCSGAINELNSKGAQVMTQAEYDALPASKLTDNVVRYISDGQSAAEGLWAKVGSDTLTTTAQTCSGAINELKSNLTELENRDFELVAYKSGLSTSLQAITYSSELNYTDYKMLIFSLAWQVGANTYRASGAFMPSTLPLDAYYVIQLGSGFQAYVKFTGNKAGTMHYIAPPSGLSVASGYVYGIK